MKGESGLPLLDHVVTEGGKTQEKKEETD